MKPPETESKSMEGMSLNDEATIIKAIERIRHMINKDGILLPHWTAAIMQIFCTLSSSDFLHPAGKEFVKHVILEEADKIRKEIKK